MGFQYQWRELQLISVTTITNIIAVIQFALIPLDIVQRQMEEKAEEETEVDSIEEIQVFLTINLGPAATLFNAPLEFVKSFQRISTPFRVLLFAVVLFGLLSLLVSAFFLPGWRLVLFLADLAMPFLFLMGCLWINKDYSAQRGVAIALVIIGLFYILGRIFWMLYPRIFKKNIDWDLIAARRISCIFLARLTGRVDANVLDARADSIRKKIMDMDVSLNADKSTMISKLIDVAVSCALLIVICVLTWGVGWGKILGVKLTGDQKPVVDTVLKTVCTAVLIAVVIRIIIACLWFIPAFPRLSLKLRRLAFKGIFILAGVFLVPVLSMILRSTDTKDKVCPYNHYFDFRCNTPDFIDFFRDRNVSCVQCSDASKRGEGQCKEVCLFNGTVINGVVTEGHPLIYKILKEAEQVGEDDLSHIYLVPINLLEVYFLVVFLQLQRSVFMRVLDLIEALPAPTTFLETKFCSMLAILQTSAGYIFQSFRHKQALFYFTFTQVKMFVLFFASLFPIFPVDEIKNMAYQIIPWMFFGISLVIAMTQFVGTPYVSVLHNVVNGVGYFVGGVAAMIAALVVSGTKISSKVSNTFLILIFVSQPVAAFLVPVFATRHPNLTPSSYGLEEVLKRDTALTKAYKRKRDKRRNLVLDQSDSDSSIEEKKQGDKKAEPWKIKKFVVKEVKEGQEGQDVHEEEEDVEVDFDPEFSQEEFPLTKYCPIHVQAGINKKARDMQNARDEWEIVPNIKARDVYYASEEMFEMANKLLDVVSFDRLIDLLSVSVLFVSALAGWGFGGGTAVWKKASVNDPTSLDYYLRCNQDADGRYPEYGTY